MKTLYMNIYSLIFSINFIFMLWILKNYEHLQKIKLFWDSEDEEQLELLVNDPLILAQNARYVNIEDSINWTLKKYTYKYIHFWRNFTKDYIGHFKCFCSFSSELLSELLEHFSELVVTLQNFLNSCEYTRRYYRKFKAYWTYEKCLDIRHPCIRHECPSDMECHIYQPNDGKDPEPTCKIGRKRLTWFLNHKLQNELKGLKNKITP